HRYGSVCRSKLLQLAALTGTLTLFVQPAGAKPDPAAQLRRADAAIANASAQDVGLFAPMAFSEAVREYRAAESALKNKQDAEASSAAERAVKLVEKATSVATKTRELLKDTVSLRSSVANLDGFLGSRLTSADEILKQAAAAAEAGDSGKAMEGSAKADDAKAAAPKQHLKEQRLPNLKKQIDEAESDASKEQIARAKVELDAAESSITSAKPAELFLIVDKLKAIDHLLYPPFFRVPPTYLQMADFVLQVIHYDQRHWDFQNGVIIRASGTAWLVFHCQPIFPRPPLWQVATVDRNLRVVESVKNPVDEIALADALRVDPAALAGSTVTMKLPSYAISASE